LENSKTAGLSIRFQDGLAERLQSYRRDLRRVEYGDERDPRMREFMEKIAPLNNAKEIRVPLFVVQGKTPHTAEKPYRPDAYYQIVILS